MYHLQKEAARVNDIWRYYHLLGSNLGDREAHLSYGIACLHDLLNNLTASRFLETRAEGRVAQPCFSMLLWRGKQALIQWNCLKPY